MDRALIVPAPHQTDQELAQQLVGLANELGLPSSAIATDTGGPRLAYRVATELYDAWLIEMGVSPAADAAPEPVALPAQDSSATPAAGDDSAGAGVEGSAAPAVSGTTTKRKQSGKAAAR